MNLAAATDYAARAGFDAVLAQRGNETLVERYTDGFDADTPHALYSGTKSFWGVLALAAQDDGLLQLDERVGETFATWNEGARSGVTLRHLLQLTSGIGFGGLGSAVPSYEKALAVELKAEPGTTFTYGGIPLQVFGAVLAEKLRAREETPHEYLQHRILDPAGVHVAKWRILRDGTQPLPTGAFLTARAWATYGRAVLAHPATRACFAGSSVNPRYGLGFWLAPGISPDIAWASGSGGQAMYLVPSHDLVIVRFASSGSYAHEPFVKRLFSADAR